MIRAWLARRKARLQHARLIEEMRNNWRIIDQSVVQCVDTTHGQRQLAGHLTIVAEANDLNERRVRVITKPDGFSETRHPRWADYKLWEAKAQPILPPFTAVEAIR